MGLVRGPGPDIVEGIRRIKSQDGPDLMLSGSSTLTSTLLEHGLADEVLLVVYPVLLCTGKRFFAEGDSSEDATSSVNTGGYARSGITHAIQQRQGITNNKRQIPVANAPRGGARIRTGVFCSKVLSTGI